MDGRRPKSNWYWATTSKFWVLLAMADLDSPLSNSPPPYGVILRVSAYIAAKYTLLASYFAPTVHASAVSPPAFLLLWLRSFKPTPTWRSERSEFDMQHPDLNRSRSRRMLTYRNHHHFLWKGYGHHHYRNLPARMVHHFHYYPDIAKQSSSHRPNQRSHCYGRLQHH